MWWAAGILGITVTQILNITDIQYSRYWDVVDSEHVFLKMNKRIENPLNNLSDR